MAKFATIGDYVAALPADTREVLVDLLAVVRSVLPGAEESISYDIPTFAVDGRSVVHVAGWRHHVSLYPVPSASDDDPDLAADLAPYVAGRGTLRFELAGPVPHDLVTRVVTALVARSRPGPGSRPPG